MTSRLDEVAWPVITSRLAIRRATVDDIEATWGYRRLPEVVYWLRTTPRTFEEYRSKFDGTGRLDRTLVVELDGFVVGDLMLKVQDGWAQNAVEDHAKEVEAELGWTLDPDYGGRGYATEAVDAMLRICFEDLALRRVTAVCFADNTSSWRLMERLGMRRETRAVRESLHLSGAWLDTLGYALLADEWAARTLTSAGPEATDGREGDVEEAGGGRCHGVDL